jgi:peptide/nickel transport system substrate-binding protein
MKLARLILPGLAALALDAGVADAQTPKRGGTLNYAISAETPTYDCAASDTYATLHFSSPFYSTLLRFDLANYPKVMGDLAESWTVSPDQKTYTFKLRSNVVFHDGSPFSSADIKATYDRLRNPPQGVVSLRKSTLEDVDTIETPDPLTVVFKLKNVSPGLLEHFASPWNCIYSAAKLATAPNFPAQNVMGTGPFRFVEHVKGSHVSGARNDKYFMPGLPYLDGFKGVFLTQPAAMLNSIQGGQVMAEFRSVSPAEADRLKQAMGDKIRVEEMSWVLNLLITFNTTKKPFDDVRVRQALSMAVDRWGGSQNLSRISSLKAVGGIMRPGTQFATPEAELVKFPGFGKDINAARAEARRLLAAAGVPNLSFTLLNRSIPNPYNPAGIYLVDQWRQIGVTAQHSVLETAPYLAGLGSDQFDVAIDFSNLFMDDPNLVLSKYLSFDRSPENKSRTIDREIDSLFDRQRRSSDPEMRGAIIRQIEQRALTQSYSVPFLWWNRMVASNVALMGWKMSPSHNLGQDLRDVWLNQ